MIERYILNLFFGLVFGVIIILGVFGEREISRLNVGALLSVRVVQLVEYLDVYVVLL